MNYVNDLLRSKKKNKRSIHGSKPVDTLLRDGKRGNFLESLHKNSIPKLICSPRASHGYRRILLQAMNDDSIDSNNRTKMNSEMNQRKMPTPDFSRKYFVPPLSHPSNPHYPHEELNWPDERWENCNHLELLSEYLIGFKTDSGESLKFVKDEMRFLQLLVLQDLKSPVQLVENCLIRLLRFEHNLRAFYIIIEKCLQYLSNTSTQHPKHCAVDTNETRISDLQSINETLTSEISVLKLLVNEVKPKSINKEEPSPETKRVPNISVDYDRNENPKAQMIKQERMIELSTQVASGVDRDLDQIYQSLLSLCNSKLTNAEPNIGVRSTYSNELHQTIRNEVSRGKEEKEEVDKMGVLFNEFSKKRDLLLIQRNALQRINPEELRPKDVEELLHSVYTIIEKVSCDRAKSGTRYEAMVTRNILAMQKLLPVGHALAQSNSKKILDHKQTQTIEEVESSFIDSRRRRNGMGTIGGMGTSESMLEDGPKATTGKGLMIEDVNSKRRTILVPWAKFMRRWKPGGKPVVIKRRLEQGTVQSIMIGDIYMKKLLLESDNRAHDSKSRRKSRKSLAKFVNHYFVQKYGLKKMAEEYVLGLIDSIRQNEKLDPPTKSSRISLFGKLLGVVDAQNYNENITDAILEVFVLAFGPEISKVAPKYSQGEGSTFIKATKAYQIVKQLFVSVPTIVISESSDKPHVRDAIVMSAVASNELDVKSWTLPQGYRANIFKWLETNSGTLTELKQLNEEKYGRKLNFKGSKSIVVDFDDFICLLHQVLISKCELDRYIFAKLFHKFDNDENGVLSYTEFTTLVNNIQCYNPEAEVDGEIVNLVSKGFLKDSDYSEAVMRIGKALTEEDILDLWDEVNENEQDNDLESVEKDSFAKTCLERGLQLPYWMMDLTLGESINELHYEKYLSAAFS